MTAETLTVQKRDGAAQLHDLLRLRRSPRAFDTQPIAPDQLALLFEAARWSPSAANSQPWRFILTTRGQEAYQRLASTLSGRNQLWAPNAPVLALAVAKTYDETRGQPMTHALYDLGQAVAHLTTEASALGLYVHQMGGFDVERARQEFAIPDEYQPVTVFAVGHLGDPETLPDVLRERELAPRERKPLDELVFDGAWGEPAQL